MSLPFSSLSFSVAAILLASCSSPSNTSMTLLKSGSPSICAASDVEATLRNLILGDNSAKDYAVSFDNATLQSFDKPISKASCHATVRIVGPSHPVVEEDGIDFVVSPSAQNPDTFMVAASVDELRSQIEYDAAEQVTRSREQAREEHGRDALAALVKPTWLLGRWVASDAGSDRCTTGPFLDFQRGGAVMLEPNTAARWALSGTALTMTGSSDSVSYEITAADADTFTITDDSLAEKALRRCSAAEIPKIEEPQPVDSAPQVAPSSPEEPAVNAEKLPSIVTQ